MLNMYDDNLKEDDVHSIGNKLNVGGYFSLAKVWLWTLNKVV